MLKITYLGHTSFLLETEETSVLLNPGIVDDEPVVPNDLDVRVIIATNHCDDAVGNTSTIAMKAKAWVLGNKTTIQKVREQGCKPWLLHILKDEIPYEIPGLKVTPYKLHREDNEEGKRHENLGLYIEMGGMKIAYLGDTMVRGPFGQFAVEVVIAPVGGDGVFPVKDAVSLCMDAQPRIGIPVKWKSDDQPKKFVKYIEQFGKVTTPLIMEPKQVLDLQWAAGNEFRFNLT